MKEPFIPRRKLLTGAIAAPFVLGMKKALAIPHGANPGAPTDAFQAIVNSMSPGNWAIVNNFTQLKSSNLGALGAVIPQPTPTVPAGNGDPRDVLNGWSSEAYDMSRKRMYFWGHGTDGGWMGNDIYYYDLPSGLFVRASMTSQLVAYPGGLPGGPTSSPSTWMVVGANNTLTPGSDYKTAPVAASQFGHPYAGNVYLPVLDAFCVFGSNTTNGGTGGSGNPPFTVSGPHLTTPTSWDPVTNQSYKIADGSRYQKVGGLAGSDPLGWNGTLQPGLCPAGNMWTDRQTFEQIAVASSPSGASFAFVGTDALCTLAFVESGFDTIYFNPYTGAAANPLWKYVFSGGSSYVGNSHALVVGADALVQIGGDPTFGGSIGGGQGDYIPNRAVFMFNVSSGAAVLTYWAADPTSQANGGSNPNIHLTSPQLVDNTGGAFAAWVSSGNTGVIMPRMPPHAYWDPDRGRITCWGGGPQVFYITPPTGALSGNWTITQAPTPAGVAWAQQATNGLYFPPVTETAPGQPITNITASRRFVYLPDYKVWFGHQDYSQGVMWAYKPG